jgi:hypothetical protein
MKTPLSLVVVVVLGGISVLLALISGYQWYLEEFPGPDASSDSRGRMHHPNYRSMAEQTLDQLNALPAAEREALLDGLRAALVPVPVWLDGLDRAGFGLLCLGEEHDDHTRRFLAEQVLPALPLDTLHLETTPAGLADIERRLRLGRDYTPLLGADIGGVLRAARLATPKLTVTAIEETEQQGKDRLRAGTGSREDSLVGNLAAVYVPGRRNAVLMGALHCTDDAGWLYERTRRRLPPDDAERAVSMRILGEHQDGPLEAFIYFLDETGIAPADFALTDPHSLPPLVQVWFRLLWHETIGRFDTVLVFRAGPPRGG